MSVYIHANVNEFRIAVNSMLQQTVRPEEFTIVCDGPVEEDLDAAIAEYLREYPQLFTLIRLPEKQGLGAALQTGLLACRNDLVARMDADDIALQDRMEKQLSAMKRYHFPAAIGGQIGEFTQDMDHITGYRIVPLSQEEIQKWIGRRCPLNHMTVLLHKPQILAVGGYRPIPRYEDYDLWIRVLAQKRPIYNIPDVCCYARTDSTFYLRRGGWTYFLDTYKMEKTILDHGMIGRFHFLCNIIVRFTCTVLMTPSCRKWFYNCFLRKSR